MSSEISILLDEIAEKDQRIAELKELTVNQMRSIEEYQRQEVEYEKRIAELEDEAAQFKALQKEREERSSLAFGALLTGRRP